MEGQQWGIKELEGLRNELNMRIVFLHRTINLAVAFWLVFLLAVFYLISTGLPEDLLITFLLMMPIVFDLLAYNYQSNQNSLESIARYIHQVVRPRVEEMTGYDVLAWEKYFAIQKEPFKFESIFKVFPFVLPSAIPLVLLAKVPLTPFQRGLALVDILFLVLMLENFRYKLRRVK